MRIVGALGALALVSLQVVSCAEANPSTTPSAEAATPEKTISVQVVQAKEGRMASTLSYTGDVKPRAQVALSAKGMGRIEELSVEVGATVTGGQVIGHIERSSLEAQLRQAEAAVAIARAKLAQMEAGTRAETITQAQGNLDAVREKYEAMLEGGRAETISQAEAVLRVAEGRLAQLEAGATKEQIQQAEAAVRAARNQLYAVQAQADAYLGTRGMPFTEEMKKAQAGASYEQVAIAEARLAELKAGATTEQIVQAQAAVDQARAALEIARKPFTTHDLKQAESAVIAAEQQLKLAERPFTANDFAMARAPIAQAEANVDFVKAQLADTNILSPMDGVVAEKHLSVGALASPQTSILTIISNDQEIALAFEEALAGQVSIGQPVSFSVAAYPTSTFTGTITSVAPTVDPRTRTFAVKVSASDDDGKLKAGMLARVRVNIGERTAAIVVPEQAVTKRGTENTVFTVVDGRARSRRVELGASDGKNVEVKSGLEAGAQIVVGSGTIEGSGNIRDGDAVVVEKQ